MFPHWFSKVVGLWSQFKGFWNISQRIPPLLSFWETVSVLESIVLAQDVPAKIQAFLLNILLGSRRGWCSELACFPAWGYGWY